MNSTRISWVRNPPPIAGHGFTWNPILGCKAASAGCLHCYAARLASTRLAHLPQYQGLAHDGKWSGEVRFFPEKLAEPLRRRTPSGIFLNDMGDTFHESVTNEQIAAMYGVMAACPQHLFYVCTKRAKRRRELFSLVETNRTVKWGEHAGEKLPDAGWLYGRVWQHWSQGIPAQQGKAYRLAEQMPWPLPNVIELTSVENQATADERIPDALATPAAVRGLSMEPLLEGVKLRHEWLGRFCGCGMQTDACDDWKAGHCKSEPPRLSWIVAGGESGSHARPCNVEWIRSIVRQCRDAGVPVHVKQMGANAREAGAPMQAVCNRCGGKGYHHGFGEDGHDPDWCSECGGPGSSFHKLRDRAGANPDEWPEDLKVRQMPKENR